ncbi:MAG: hypothetical protein ACYS8Z_06490, partial [Planctomycetota bacterium]
MKTTILTALFLSISAAVVLPADVSQAEPVAPAFTYQGRLIDANTTADGHYDFEFAMYDSPVDGNQLTRPEEWHDLDVIDGYFTVELHFGGAVFAGDERWLQIGVRPGELSDPNGYTPLHPRQRISPAPYALYALSGNEGPPGPPGDSHWISNGADIYYVEGNVGVGTDRPNSRLEAIAIAPTPSIFAFNGGPGSAIVGESVMGDGVAGESIDPNRSGVYGHSVNGVGVSGRSEENNGVVGWTSVADKSGVYGWSEFGYGVTGRSEAISGRGVFGVATDTNGVGVYGLSANGHAGYFEGDAYFAGNVGIGATNPVNKLDVKGGMAVGASYSGANTAPTNGAIIEGYVGIGTTDPQSALHIASPAPTVGMYLENLRTTSAWGIWADDVGALHITERDTPLSTVARFRIDRGGKTCLAHYGGNVGIGTETPSEKIEVKGG